MNFTRLLEHVILPVTCIVAGNRRRLSMRVSTLVLTAAFAFPLFATAHEHKAEHRHSGRGIIWYDQLTTHSVEKPGREFAATGRICSGPSFDQYGDLVTSKRDQAERKADEEAARACYPFQFRRVSDFSYVRSNDECQTTNEYTIRETVWAQYTCAPFDE